MLGPRYRLQEDLSWRNLNNQFGKFVAPINEDKFFNSLEEMKNYPIGNKLTIDNKDFQVNPSEISLGDPSVAFTDPRVYRITKPKLFTKGEMLETIAAGIDDKVNVLVVDINGKFQLLDFHQDLIGRRNFAPIAVRHEAYCAGNGYVGFQAARDERFRNDEYLSSLEGWLTHLKTGKLDIFIDYCEGKKSETQLIREINEITDKLEH